MKNIVSTCAAILFLTGCAGISLPKTGISLPKSNNDGTLSKFQMEAEWKTASTQCKNLYRQYTRSIQNLNSDDLERFSEVNDKAQATAEQYNCNQKYLTTLAVESMS